MRAQTIFNKLLSMQGAFVRAVTFHDEREESTIVADVVRRSKLHRCPSCDFRTAATYDQHPRTWRHLSLGKWRVLVSCTLHRIECPDHGVLNEAVPWAAAGSLFTLDFETWVAWLAREMNKTAVAALAKISWPTVGTIISRFVERNIDKKRLEDLFVIGLDEVSYRKGHKYITVVANHATGAPVWMAEGRSQKVLGTFFDELGKERGEKLAIVSMDMAAAYIAEVRDRVPGASIAFDPFHVVKLASEAVQEVRRTEARERKGSAEADVLKDARWATRSWPPPSEVKAGSRLPSSSIPWRCDAGPRGPSTETPCSPPGASPGSARVLGPEHPSTLDTLASLALVLHAQGELAAAEALAREALAGELQSRPDTWHRSFAESLLGAGLADRHLPSSVGRHRWRRIPVRADRPAASAGPHIRWATSRSSAGTRG